MSARSSLLHGHGLFSGSHTLLYEIFRIASIPYALCPIPYTVYPIPCTLYPNTLTPYALYPIP